ncbi:XK-related protein 6-like isoform X3 [Tachypleus tridentatus]|uniref:XK-related protein 6-like isoform X3 n=1 Tax=Tachypleus tridentatus TaxID=6853 RepID=UPI003FD03831
MMNITRKMEDNEGDDRIDENTCSCDNTLASEQLDGVSAEEMFVFSVFECVLLLSCIGSFLFDTGSDLLMCYFHYTAGNIWYFGLTAAFVIIPALTMTGFSLRWYVLDLNNRDVERVSWGQWVVRVVFLILQLGPVIRYLETLWYGFKVRSSNKTTSAKEQKVYYCKMVYEDSDAAMLRLFECYMESAPQLILQLFILARSPYPEHISWQTIFPWLSILFSLISLSTSLVSYQSALRRSLPNKNDLSKIGKVVMFMWRLFVIASRVVALSLFASYNPIALGIFCGIHWIVMTLWIISMKTDFYDNKYEEYLYDAVLGVQFIFCYFNPVDSPTRSRITIYYILVFIENTILMFIWYYNSSPDLWYHVVAMCFQFISFPIGIVFMVECKKKTSIMTTISFLCVLIYYLMCHPTGNIEVWRTNKRKCPIQQRVLTCNIVE